MTKSVGARSNNTILRSSSAEGGPGRVISIQYSVFSGGDATEDAETVRRGKTKGSESGKQSGGESKVPKSAAEDTGAEGGRRKVQKVEN